MREYVWLFPLIFIFHDMEEIVGFGWWLEKNGKMLADKYPSVLKTYTNFSTAGFAFAVYEELVLCLAVCVAAVLTNSMLLWGIWLGGLVGCTLHFVIHIGQSIVVRQYIPAVATSVLCLPASVWLIYRSIPEILYKISIKMSHMSGMVSGRFVMGKSVCADKVILGVLVVVGVVIVAVNVKLAQRMIGWFTDFTEKSIRNYKDMKK